MSRVPLPTLVRKIVDKWSVDLLKRANEGDTEAMLQVAEFSLSRSGGWGQIRKDPIQGRKWIEVAAKKGDPSAIIALRNMVRIDKERLRLQNEARERQLERARFPSIDKPEGVKPLDTGKKQS